MLPIPLFTPQRPSPANPSYLSDEFATQELPWHLQALVLIGMEESFVNRLLEHLGDRSVIVERSCWIPWS